MASTDGRILVPETTGLYYNRNRHYSPTMGRFLQRDPNATGLPLLVATAMCARIAHTDESHPNLMLLYSDSLNIYQYVGANPVNWRDPTGLSLLSLALGSAESSGFEASAMASAAAALNTLNAMALQMMVWSYQYSTALILASAEVFGSFDQSVWSSLISEADRYYSWATKSPGRAQAFNRGVEAASQSGMDPRNFWFIRYFRGRPDGS